MLQTAPNPKFRLPEAVKPSEFFAQIDPTPKEPGINQVLRMPEYPRGSLFMQNGLMAASPGFHVAEQINAMSAWQNTLAPPPNQSANLEVLQHGTEVFNQAGCVECHSGRYFTNHEVIPQPELGTQPSRGKASAAFARNFVPPQTYPANVSVPLPPNLPVLPVPTEITPQRDIELSYAISNSAGGYYKVPNLIGLYLSAPYLHDGGVAAGAEALQLKAEGYTISNPEQFGMAVTLLQGIQPDPDASLWVLVDRHLR